MVVQHPLGYRKLYLLRTQWFQIRLHLWWTDRRGASEKPHNHRWSFLAIPLWRSFTERRYLRHDGDSHVRYATTPPRDGRDRTWRRMGTDRLVQCSSRTRRPWVPYRCRLGEIHAYQPHGTGRHLSLVLMGRTRRPESNVWSEVPNGQDA